MARNTGQFAVQDERRNTTRGQGNKFVKQDDPGAIAWSADVQPADEPDHVTVTAGGQTITIPAAFAHLIRAEPAPPAPGATVVFRCPRAPDGRFKIYPPNGEVMPYLIAFENGTYRTSNPDEIDQLTRRGLAGGVYVDPPDGRERQCSICKAKGYWPFAAYAQEPMDEHIKVKHSQALD